MNLGELRAEVKARGFDDIADARIDRWINAAIREINDAENWWWLMATMAGASPLSLPSLKAVHFVSDTSQSDRKLKYEDFHDLYAMYPDLFNRTGAPVYYWIDQNVIKTYPSGGSLFVSYVSTGADLSVDSDVPSIPVAYHDLIVTGAVRKAYLDSDEFDAANQMRQEVALGIEQLRVSQLDRQDDSNDRIVLVDTWL